jgi:hypothetical protein
MVDDQIQTHCLRYGMVLLDKPVSTWALREHRNEPINYLEMQMITLIGLVTDHPNWPNGSIDEAFHEEMGYALMGGRFRGFAGLDVKSFNFMTFTEDIINHVRMTSSSNIKS